MLVLVTAALALRVTDLEERVGLQEELLAKEQEKVDLGTSVYYNVSVIENDLIDARTEALRALVELQVQRADFYRATGSLLEKRGVSSDFVSPPR